MALYGIERYIRVERELSQLVSKIFIGYSMALYGVVRYLYGAIWYLYGVIRYIYYDIWYFYGVIRYYRYEMKEEG